MVQNDGTYMDADIQGRALRIFRVYGTVQGVGFRPFVWRIAHDCGITGAVWNDAEGVVIEAWGSATQLTRFTHALTHEPPPLANITHLHHEAFSAQTKNASNSTAPRLSSDTTAATAPTDFKIAASRSGQTLTAVGADAASCAQCLAEVNDPSNRRYGYPFTNCTHCGPRFSIIQHVPYDRAHTSMAAFPMCEACQAEYETPDDRRFHAQPNACADCGPSAWFITSTQAKALIDKQYAQDWQQPSASAPQNLAAIYAAAAAIQRGEIVAIKGLGGFHLACDASNAEAVARLRARKRRQRKPLAIMAHDLNGIERFALCDQQEREQLTSPAAPIVVLRKREDCTLPQALAPQQQQLGFMLPYTPLHHLLMQQLDTPIVLTSGNISDEPQCIDNESALAQLHSIADAFVLHNRDIINRIDDSLVRCVPEHPPSILRRARGYAPQPIALPEGFTDANGVLAMGADLKNTFCLLNRGQAIISQHIGDLENLASQRDYRTQISRLSQLYDFTPQSIVVDKHPNYHSRHVGEALADAHALPLKQVQHHHAHIASVMAEHRLPLNTAPVLGIALDGLGFGDDGELWGGELLLCDYRQSQRVARFRPTPLLGGNVAMQEPWRNTLAQLMATPDFAHTLQYMAEHELIQFLQSKPLKVLERMAEKNLNSPLSSSAGRLFDSVAGALNVCRETQDFEGEAAMILESLALHACEQDFPAYPHTLHTENDVITIQWDSLWHALLKGLQQNMPKSYMAFRFHSGVAAAIASVVEHLHTHADHVFTHIALSGGVIQNHLLKQLLQTKLEAIGLPILFPKSLPANDGGISFGQAAIAYAQSK